MRPRRLGPALPPAVAAVSAQPITPRELGLPLFFASLRQVLELPPRSTRAEILDRADDERLGYRPAAWPDGVIGLVCWNFEDGGEPDGEALAEHYVAWRRWWSTLLDPAAGSA